MSDAETNRTDTASDDIDPTERPGDAVEEAGIVDQQAVAVQAVQEADDDAGS